MVFACGRVLGPGLGLEPQDLGPGLGLESLVLGHGLGLEVRVLVNITGNWNGYVGKV